MSKTPKGKQNLNDSLNYSPVILPESPGGQTSKNLTGLPRVARDIAADIYNNIQHWNSLHIQGASLINEIAGLKANDRKIYPNGIEPLIIQMSEIIDILKIISHSLSVSSQQLNSLIKLHKSPVPLFISWTCDKMSQVGNIIAESYNQEFKLKQYVVENICHIDNKNKIMFLAACWIHQPYITDEVNLHLEAFLTETGHRKVT